MLEAEMDISLGDDSSCKLTDNSRNRYSSKRLKREFEQLLLATYGNNLKKQPMKIRLYFTAKNMM